MKTGLLVAISFFALQGAWAQNKPTPGTDIETVLRTLDCAGTVQGQQVKLKPGAVKENEGEFEILTETKLADFPKSFLAVGTYTSRDQYVIHGNQPEAFMLMIDKLGVHGAHNASLEFPFSPNERYSFECYF